MKKSKLVDFHCHLDLFPDFQKAVETAESAEIFTLSVTTTPRAWPYNKTLMTNTRFVRAALGLHPQVVSQYAHEIDLWERYLPQTRYVGEIGLDAGPQYYKTLPLQKKIFERILKCCEKSKNKVLSIHSVRSATTVLDLLDKHLSSDGGKVVLHWFTGSLKDASRAIERGYYFSVNYQMLQSERGRKLAQIIPLNLILTETDAPFVNYDGQNSSEQYLLKAISELANLHSVKEQELQSMVYKNLKSLLT